MLELTGPFSTTLRRRQPAQFSQSRVVGVHGADPGRCAAGQGPRFGESEARPFLSGR